VPASAFQLKVSLQEDTISINHNWGNACNLDLFWKFLRDELLDVEKEIAHLQDSFSTTGEWIEQCQLILKANSGIDYAQFAEYITLMARRELKLAAEAEDFSRTQQVPEGRKRLALFSLFRVKLVLDEMLEDSAVKALVEHAKMKSSVRHDEVPRQEITQLTFLRASVLDVLSKYKVT